MYVLFTRTNQLTGVNLDWSCYEKHNNFQGGGGGGDEKITWMDKYACTVIVEGTFIHPPPLNIYARFKENSWIK